MQAEQIKKFPKVELHCHLDGSISEKALRRILRNADDDPETVDDRIDRMRYKCGAVNLAEYLTCFAEVMPYLQSEENLAVAAYELIRQAAAEHVIYIEVRFAPMYHGKQGLRQIDAVKAVLKGLELGEKDFGVKSRLLLCMMRGKPEEINEETLSCAREMRGYGVAGVDLAGNEAAYPPQLYRALLAKAQAWRIPFTIHAGECGSAGNVRTAVEMGASRIGHGVAIADDEEIKEICRKQKIVLEMCPVSNLQTGAVRAIEKYPWARLHAEGIPVTVNTDNRTVSDTTLVTEWETLDRQFRMVDEQVLERAGIAAVEAAFLPWQEKAELKKMIVER